ncbi:hypothetical protein D3C81_620410 [compost metagenome]
MHLHADAVLVQRIQRVVGQNGDAAQLADVVDHQLTDLVLERLGRHAVEAAQDEHRGVGSGG